MTTNIQGNIAILAGYLVLVAAMIDLRLAVLLVVALAVGVSAYALRIYRG